ncbi:MAG: asparaginase domain-containing protein [Moraxella sp.]|nr:asparaginase domain-containing protein [Moraxella sp.]
MNLPIHLIYAGGTFGCHGTPLSPLPATQFLPAFLSLLDHQDDEFVLLSNHIVKDSSHLAPSDFVHFYHLITDAYHQGARRFMLITGTDTLSFLGAFLSNALAYLNDVSVFITGSMHPLFNPTTTPYTIDKTGDAWQNLSLCLTHMDKFGVFVVVGDVFWANNTQKIHSKDNHAFIGLPITHPPTPFNIRPPKGDFKNPTAPIKTIYLTPNSPDVLADELNTDAIAVILIAFGAGNVPSSPDVISSLNALTNRSVPVVCTSMCAFGGVSADYGAGAWQYEYGVWSGKELTVAGIYGKLLWLYLSDNLTFDNW